MPPQGLDQWGHPIPPVDVPPEVGVDDGPDAMRAAILDLMRHRRNVLLAGGNGVRLALITPSIRAPSMAASGTAFMACIWSLVRDGILLPGSSSVHTHPDQTGNDTYRHFPFFTVTPLGRQLLEGDAVTPYNRAGYLSDARARLGVADEGIFVYLAEANKNFLDRSDLSASVMLGVSSELLMKWLIARFIAHVPEPQRRALEEERRKLWPRTKALFETFTRKFQDHGAEFPRDLETQVDAHLGLIQTLIRINRDDVGHGRAQRIDHEMVEGHLLNYLTLLKLARELADALTAPCAL